MVRDFMRIVFPCDLCWWSHYQKFPTHCANCLLALWWQVFMVFDWDLFMFARVDKVKVSHTCVGLMPFKVCGCATYPQCENLQAAALLKNATWLAHVHHRVMNILDFFFFSVRRTWLQPWVEGITILFLLGWPIKFFHGVHSSVS